MLTNYHQYLNKSFVFVLLALATQDLIKAAKIFELTFPYFGHNKRDTISVNIVTFVTSKPLFYFMPTVAFNK